MALVRPQRWWRHRHHALGHSFYTNPLDASYDASKAAEWSWTNSNRVELAHQGTLVEAVHPSFIDTDMAAGIDRQDQPRVKRQQAFDPGRSRARSRSSPTNAPRFVKASVWRDHELISPEVTRSGTP